MQKTQFERLTLALALVLVVAALGGVNIARAGTFDPAAAGVALTNTSPDMDLFFLSQFVGAFPGQTLSYEAIVSSTGFSESLTGMYGASSLDVGYTATVEQFAPGSTILAWTSTGTYGSSSESSLGTVTFEYMGAPGMFQEYYQDSLTVGANTASAGLTITGENNSDVYSVTDSYGTIDINGLVTPIVSGSGFFHLVWPGTTLPYISPFPSSCVAGYNSVNGQHPCLPPYLIPNDIANLYFLAPDQGRCFSCLVENGSVSVFTPEPASTTLMLIGLGWLMRKRIAQGVRQATRACRSRTARY
jgi:hypothetical protein